MGIQVKIRNKEVFQSRVGRVDVEGLKCEGTGVFSGGVCIYTLQGGLSPFYGLINANDFEEEYGFRLITL